MNKEYAYIDGKVIIRDEFNNSRLLEYQNNLEEVLIQENVVETIENKINELEKQLKKYENLPKRFIPYTLITTILEAIFAPKILFAIFKKYGGVDLYKEMFVSTSSISTATIINYFVLAICFLLGTIFTIIEYSSYKENKKEFKGITSELSYLRKSLILEKNNLEKLKSEARTVILNQEFKVNKIDDSYELDNLNDHINLHYHLGYDEKRYLKWIKKGILEKKLENDYTEYGIEMVKEYFEDKKKILVKKR